MSGLSRDDARSLVESFALRVFSSADDDDRAGRATQQTAQQFYAAYVFMDVCRQWGELASDLEQKIKYAMWKAADINRAIKEGRTPKPGGAGDDDEFGMGDGLGGGGSGGSGGGGGSSGSGLVKAESRAGGSGAAPGGFVPGGGSGDNEDEHMAQSLQRMSVKPDEPMDEEEEKAPLGQLQYPPSFSSPSSSLPTSYLPSSQFTSAYSDASPPVPPQPPLSPTTATSLGFTPSGQPFAPSASGRSPGYSASYSPGFLGPALPPPPDPSSHSTAPSSASLPSQPPPATAPRPNLPAPSVRRPGSVPPSPASDSYSSSSRYSPALPSQITPSVLPAVGGKSRSVAMKEADRLMKHAGSALSFDDVDTAIVKMQQAIALLYNHRTVVKSDQDR